MKYRKTHRNLVSLLAAAALSLPVLAHAGTDNGKGNDYQNNGNQYGKDKGDPTVTSTPEPNTAIVLIPFLGAEGQSPGRPSLGLLVLLELSARRAIKPRSAPSCFI
jgi:hypothetical protein